MKKIINFFKNRSRSTKDLKVPEMDFNPNASFGHEYLHTAIPMLIEERNLLSMVSIIEPALNEYHCKICAELLVENYPAVESSWMDWNGFDEFESWTFFKAVEIIDLTTIFDKQQSSWQWPLIFRAISNNDIEFVKHLIKVSPKFLSQKCDNDSVLEFSIALGRTEIVLYLLDLANENKVAKKYVHVGNENFIAACTSSVCGLTIVLKLLDIIMSRKEEGLLSGLYVGFQIMTFKRPDCLKQVLNYFFEKYHDEIKVLYEPSDDSDTILFALAHEHMTSAVLKILEVAPEAANGINGKTGKTLLMRAIELENIELANRLLEDYKVDIFTKDKSGHNIFTYACIYGNLNMMEYLLKKGIDTPIKVQTNVNDEMHIIPCDDLMTFVLRAADGSLDLNIFHELVRCLYETYPNSCWPWIKNDILRKFLFPKLRPEQTTDELKENFDKVYKILFQYKVTLRCSNVFDTIMLDTSISYDRKEMTVKNGMLQTQMSLMVAEPNLEYPCPEMYGTKEFDLIKDYINIDDFNEICGGREVASLKRFCRTVIRKEIFNQTFIKKLNDSPINAQALIEKAFNSLSLPKNIISFLRYQY